MSTIEQINLIKKYYKPFIRFNLNDPIKLCLCSFYPYALNEWDNDEYIFGSEGYYSITKLAIQNKGFDLNKDSAITMAEYKLYHKQKIYNIK